MPLFEYASARGDSLIQRCKQCRGILTSRCISTKAEVARSAKRLILPRGGDSQDISEAAAARHDLIIMQREHRVKR